MTFNARIEWLNSVDSTNAEAIRRAAAGESGPLWIGALEQTAGKGRRARRWASGSGDLTATLMLEPKAWRPSADASEVATLSFLAAVCVGETAAALRPDAQILHKWPNDVLLNGGKLAGILLEAREPALAIGIGVNLAPDVVSVDPSEAHGQTLRPAPLNAAGGLSISPERFLNELVVRFAQRFEEWRVRGFEAVRGAWLERAARRGAELTVRLHSETFSGRFMDIDAQGALMLETPRGVRLVHAGDVYWRTSNPTA